MLFTCEGRQLGILTNTISTDQNCAVGKRPVSDSSKENCCPGDNEPPRKCGQKSVHAEHHCGDCTVWPQTGGDQKLLKYYKRE